MPGEPVPVPVVEGLRAYLPGGGDAAARRAAAGALDAACRGHGFASAVGLVDTGLAERAFAAAEALFAAPGNAARLRRWNPGDNMGFSPMASEALDASGGRDLKESFNVRCPRRYENDFAGCPAAFRDAALELWAALEAAGLGLATCAADALGLEPDFFAKTLESLELTTLRFLHYPPCPDAFPGPGGSAPVRLGAHTDFGLFTLLLVRGGEEGLELAPAELGEAGGGNSPLAEWRPAEVVRGATLINTGALTARWTNDVWKATGHRVVVPSAAAAARHRYSIAFFIDPDADAEVRVHPQLVPSGEEPKVRTCGGRGGGWRTDLDTVRADQRRGIHRCKAQQGRPGRPGGAGAEGSSILSCSCSGAVDCS